MIYISILKGVIIYLIGLFFLNLGTFLRHKALGYSDKKIKRHMMSRSVIFTICIIYALAKN